MEKVFQIDKHIGVTISGLLSDARVLIQKAQTKAQTHKVTYDEPIDVITLAKDIADQQQLYTQYGGARPYGVALLFAGIDETGPRLFMTEPSGIFFEYKATSMGEGSPVVTKMLNDNYKDSMTMEHGIKLGISALKEVLGKKFSKERIDIATISAETKRYSKLSRQEIEKYLKPASK